MCDPCIRILDHTRARERKNPPSCIIIRFFSCKLSQLVYMPRESAVQCVGIRLPRPRKGNHPKLFASFGKSQIRNQRLLWNQAWMTVCAKTHAISLKSNKPISLGTFVRNDRPSCAREGIRSSVKCFPTQKVTTCKANTSYLPETHKWFISLKNNSHDWEFGPQSLFQQTNLFSSWPALGRVKNE